MISYVAKTFQVSRHTAKAMVITFGLIAVGTFGGAMYALGPYADRLREDRVDSHCIPIGIKELGGTAISFTVTGKALSRCWVTTDTGDRWIVWYGGDIDDRYGLEIDE